MPFDPNKVIRAIWCVDSETSDEVLINLATNEILMRRTHEKELINPEPPKEAPQC